MTQSHTKARELVAMLPPVVLGVSATCYALGLLIVNIYLNRYGVYAVEFVRSDFVLVGAVFIFLVVFATAGAAHGVPIAIQMPTAWRARKKGLLLSLAGKALFAFVLAPGGALTTLSRYTFGLDRWEFWFSLILLAGIGGHAGDLFRRGKYLFHTALNPSETTAQTPSLMSQAYFAADVVVSMCIAIASYALITYPHLAPAYGGGHRDAVLLIPNAEGTQIAKHLNLPINAQGDVGPVMLLSDNPNELVIIAGDEDANATKAIRLDRKYFNAIVAVAVSTSARKKAPEETKEGRSRERPAPKHSPKAPTAVPHPGEAVPPAFTVPGAELSSLPSLPLPHPAETAPPAPILSPKTISTPRGAEP